MEDGSLLRTGRLEANHFGAGGNGGFIERRDWLNNVLWSYEISANVGSEFPYSLHGQSIFFKLQGSCLFTDAQGRILAQYTFGPNERISIPAQGFNQWILLHVQTATGMNTQRIFVHD
ncbi:MAG: hypothetical protein ACKO66_09415 [Flavobacteriales bacterium]